VLIELKDWSIAMSTRENIRRESEARDHHQQAPAASRQVRRALLGHSLISAEPVFLEDNARQQGLYVLGATGTGKSSIFLNLIVHDIAAGHGVCVLDPHGDLINDVLRRLPAGREQDLVLLDPGDPELAFGLNFFEARASDDIVMRARIADQAVEVFKKAWGDISWGPLLEDLLRNIAYTLLDNPDYTLADIPHFLRDAEFRARLVKRVKNPAVHQFWTEEYDPIRPAEQRQYSNSTMNKVRTFLLNPVLRHIVGQPKSSVDFRFAMDEGKIILVKVAEGRVGGEVINLLGSLLIAQLYNAAVSRQDIPPEERRPFSLFADEYHRFATPYFAQLLTDGRKFNIKTTVAHQHRDQFSRDDPNRGSTLGAANLVIFRANAGDARDLAPHFNSAPDPTEPSLEPITEPAIEYWYEDQWKSITSEATYKQIPELKRPISGLLDVLGGMLAFNEKGKGWSYDTPDKRADLKILLSMLRSAQTSEKEIASLRLSLLFNPFIDATAKERLTGILLNTGANQPEQHSLPTEIPCAFEHYLNELQSNSEESESAKHRAEVGKHLSDEMMSLLRPLKARTMYWFDPTGALPRPQAQSILGSKNTPVVAADLCRFAGGWRVAPFSEMVDWFSRKVKDLIEREQELESLAIKNSPERVRRSRYLGYDLPVTEARRSLVRVEDREVQRYRWKAGPARPRSDVVTEIENRIARLPDHHALCRLKQGPNIVESELLTLKPPPQSPASDVASRLERMRIRGRTYLRNRDELESEFLWRYSIQDEAHKTRRRLDLPTSEKPGLTKDGPSYSIRH
jgi:hypothetical protein